MPTPKWLENYYGRDFDMLNPQVVYEGKKKAVVRLTRNGSRGFSGVGYVLIDKSGSHAVSAYKSLHEGVPQKEDLEKMQSTLKKEDV